MRTGTARHIAIATLAGGLLVCSSAASASTLLADFDNHPIPASSDIYGSWSTGTLTPGPTSYRVESAGGFGGQWNGLGDGVDASAETDIELIVTVDAAHPEAGLGVVFALVDGDGTEWQYVINTTENSWFGLLPGATYTLTVPITGATGLINPGSSSGLDTSNIIGFHIQVDSGDNNVPYDISFENFRMYVPGEDLEGDLNGDGFVGLDDLDIILSAWNQSVPPADAAADPSGDGFVGLDDLDLVLNNWNAGTPPATAVVPEPATLGLISLGGLALLRRK